MSKWQFTLVSETHQLFYDGGETYSEVPSEGAVSDATSCLSESSLRVRSLAHCSTDLIQSAELVDPIRDILRNVTKTPIATSGQLYH